MPAMAARSGRNGGDVRAAAAHAAASARGLTDPGRFRFRGRVRGDVRRPAYPGQRQQSEKAGNETKNASSLKHLFGFTPGIYLHTMHAPCQLAVTSPTIAQLCDSTGLIVFTATEKFRWMKTLFLI